MYYCGVDKEPEDLLHEDILDLKVCDRHDTLSNMSYSVLIETHKHLAFYGKIKHLPKINKGVFIRWLYRGLSFNQAKIKVNKDMAYMRSRYGFSNMLIK